MSATGSLSSEIQQVRALYPEGSRSAVLPALRLAQERYGWLSPDALREVANALELTPAYCHSIASFYDQFHLRPIGTHLVEVCTNVSCAVVGAQDVLEAFEAECGCRAGETSGDGDVHEGRPRRRPDRDRRLAGHGHGRGRPVISVKSATHFPRVELVPSLRSGRFGV